MKKLAIAVVLLALAAGCDKEPEKGVASAGGGASPGPVTTLSFLDQGIRYAQCMRGHGLPGYPDPEVLNGGDVRIRGIDKNTVDATVLGAALQACRSLQPVLSDADRAQKMAASRYEAQCMRAHGVDDYPDPDPDGHADLPDSVRENPRFDAAKSACRDLTRSFTPSPGNG